MSSDHPAMRAAFSKAKATLPQFLAIAKSPPPNASSFAVKVGIEASKGRIEYFWLTDLNEDASGSVGTIGNEPRMTRLVKVGQRYAFKRDRIVDWMYITSPPMQMHGNFTACALLTNESAAEQEAMRRQYGLRCE
jgi:uncharacterized protein YegJ (DUF2314 family)